MSDIIIAHKSTYSGNWPSFPESDRELLRQIMPGNLSIDDVPSQPEVMINFSSNIDDSTKRILLLKAPSGPLTEDNFIYYGDRDRSVISEVAPAEIKTEESVAPEKSKEAPVVEKPETKLEESKLEVKPEEVKVESKPEEISPPTPKEETIEPIKETIEATPAETPKVEAKPEEKDFFSKFLEDISKMFDDLFKGFEANPPAIAASSPDTVPFEGQETPSFDIKTSDEGAGIASGYSASYMAFHIAKAAHESGVLHDGHGSLYDPESVADHSQVKNLIKAQIIKNVLLNPEAKKKMEETLKSKAKEIEKSDDYKNNPNANLLEEVNKAAKQEYQHLLDTENVPDSLTSLTKHAITHPKSSIKNLTVNLINSFKKESTKDVENDVKERSNTESQAQPESDKKFADSITSKSDKEIGYISTPEMLKQDAINITHTFSKLTNMKHISSWTGKKINERYEAEKQEKQIER